MKFKGKEQCWERKGCGRDKDRSYPAYLNYGRHKVPRRGSGHLCLDPGGLRSM